MRLTLHTDYAFRILMYLSAKQGQLSRIDEIAEFYQISRNHLIKVMNTLVKADIIKTIRGKGGGLCLSAKAENISVGEVIRITEPDFALVGCFQPGNSCAVMPICQLKGILHQAINNFLKELDSYQLKDLLLNKGKIEELFSI